LVARLAKATKRPSAEMEGWWFPLAALPSTLLESRLIRWVIWASVGEETAAARAATRANEARGRALETKRQPANPERRGDELTVRNSIAE
jgi:hypothetical protein